MALDTRFPAGMTGYLNTCTKTKDCGNHAIALNSPIANIITGNWAYNSVFVDLPWNLS